MKSEDLFDAIGNIDGNMIVNAQTPPKQKVFYKKTAWISAIAAMFVLSVTLLGLGFLGSENKILQVPIITDLETVGSVTTESPATVPTTSTGSTPTTNPPVTTYRNYWIHALAAAIYPEEVPYPEGDHFSEEYREQYSKWSKYGTDKNQLYRELDVNIKEFLSASIGEFLSQKNGENLVFSPLNVYMAFAMLAETTDNNSRQQILDVLGCDSIETLREEASAIWQATYSDDGRITSILSSSVWLSNQNSYKQETLQQLADIYYASSFSGEMGSEEYNKALESWLNEQTGGLLKPNVEMDSETIMALATTLYFKAGWVDPFSSKNNREGTFHAANGDISCTFMNQNVRADCYLGEKFIAVPKELGLNYKSTMWLILPNEGVTPEELLTDEEAMAFLTNPKNVTSKKDFNVNLSLPKFDVSSDLDLIEGMKNLGITDVFNGSISDFSPITDDRSDIFVRAADHSARVTIDEEGCTAAAFTFIGIGPESVPLQIDVTFDRPFLFTITSDVGLPLFVGIVNQPN